MAVGRRIGNWKEEVYNSPQNPNISQKEWIKSIGDVFKKKGALREVYKDHYQEILKLSVEGKTLEVGSASGNLGDLFDDIIFTDNWFYPLKADERDISIPVCNQLFPYHSDCGNLNLKVTMTFDDFKENYDLLNEIVKKHKKKFKPNLKFQGLLMPFYCFKVPYKILCDVGYFDKSFGIGGGEDIDYRIRCAIKGYEINFLLESYILHFHGKSTWDGVETKFQTETRNEVYIKAFKKKWGSEMTQLFILRKNFSNILSEKGLEDLFKQGKFGELARRMI